jgi:hypothetical protein
MNLPLTNVGNRVIMTFPSEFQSIQTLFRAVVASLVTHQTF